MIVRRMVATCALLLVCNTIAFAKPIRLFKIYNWKAGAYASNTTNQFSHCAASAKYKSGITVYFSINRRYEWSMAFSKPDWGLNRGEVYDIAFRIDQLTPIRAKARAISPILVQVPLHDSSTLFRQFRDGQRLRVATANQVFGFKLTDTSEILPALLTCVRGYVNSPIEAERANPFKRPGTSNPFRSGNGDSTPRSDSTVTAAASRLEATTIAANLMAASGIKGFQLLSPDAAERIKVDAAWKAGSTIGTIRIVSNDNIKSLKDISGRLIGGNAKNCKGTFASGSVPEPGNDGVIRLFTACKVGDQATTIYYLAMDRRKGGYYLFSTASKASQADAKETDAMIRQAVAQAIPK